MSDTKEHIPLRVERMPDGGFVVSEAPRMDSPIYSGPLFASTSIGEALVFIAGRLEPKALDERKERAASPGGMPCAGCLDPRCTPVRCDAAARDATKPVAEPFPQRCSRCGSAGVRRYCSRCANGQGRDFTDWAGA